MSDIWLITGGARSGKSEHAQGLVDSKGNVLYIATGVETDEEMKARIEHHRASRPKEWITWERNHDFTTIERDFNSGDFETVLVDCVGNLLMGVLYEESPY